MYFLFISMIIRFNNSFHEPSRCCCDWVSLLVIAGWCWEAKTNSHRLWSCCPSMRFIASGRHWETCYKNKKWLISVTCGMTLAGTRDSMNWSWNLLLTSRPIINHDVHEWKMIFIRQRWVGRRGSRRCTYHLQWRWTEHRVPGISWGQCHRPSCLQRRGACHKHHRFPWR